MLVLLVRPAQYTYNLPIGTVTRKAKFTQNSSNTNRQSPYFIFAYTAAAFCAIWLVLSLPKIGKRKHSLLWNRDAALQTLPFFASYFLSAILCKDSDVRDLRQSSNLTHLVPRCFCPFLPKKQKRSYDSLSRHCRPGPPRGGRRSHCPGGLGHRGARDSELSGLECEIRQLKLRPADAMMFFF